MRVTVASLYSLPLAVVKSSENAAAANDKSKNIKSFVCTCRVGPEQICSQIPVFQSRRIAGQRNTQLTNQPVMSLPPIPPVPNSAKRNISGLISVDRNRSRNQSEILRYNQ